MHIQVGPYCQSPQVSVPCMHMVDLLQKRYVKILHISEDHICGIQIFQQNTVSIYFSTCTGPSY